MDSIEAELANVAVTKPGAAVATAAVATDTEVVVDVLDAFAVGNGALVIDGETYLFTAIDEATNTITLDAGTPLLADAAVGEPVALLTAAGAPAQTWKAFVYLGDGDHPVPATIPVPMVGYFVEGDAQAGQAISVVPEGEGYRVLSQTEEEPVLDGAVVWNPYVSMRADDLEVPTGVGVWTQIEDWADVFVQGMTLEADGSLTITYPGLYAIDAVPTFVANASSYRAARIMVNGVRVGYLGVPASPGGSTEVQLLARPVLAEGDNVTLEVNQTSGAATDLESLPGVSPFSMYRISV